MEIVNEHEETAPPRQPTRSSLEEERSRMQANVQNHASSMGSSSSSSSSDAAAAAGAAPPRKPLGRTNSMRGSGGGARSLPVRAASMRAVRPLAPTKSTDAMSSLRGNNVQRANSSRVLLRANSSRAPPARRGVGGRTSSIDSTNSLRAYRKEQLANTAIEAKDSSNGNSNLPPRMRGPGGTVQRVESGDVSVMTGDFSCFTMDSVNLRKTQLVADPIEDCATYNGDDYSYADHESVSRASIFSEYPAPPGARGVNKCLSSESLGPIRFDKLQITNKDAYHHNRGGAGGGGSGARRRGDGEDEEDDEDDDKSFGSMTSGLTTDFTDHDFLDDSEGEELGDDLAEIEEAQSEEE